MNNTLSASAMQMTKNDNGILNIAKLIHETKSIFVIADIASVRVVCPFVSDKALYSNAAV